ncbi:hypothetical protein [Cupriavidus plantarum]|uniref:hypothetical protein n=1 Tax=Cupriavidus plantarum TaxID=942865 RepID=UPI000E227FA2|nr:hypothetical protein [Cupriavidus plantarum]REE92543.1 hypothetical protein C7418_3810 [Cupriavidus plantarum]
MSPSSRVKTILAALALCVALPGCAPMIQTTPANIEPVQSSAGARAVWLKDTTRIKLDTGYTRLVPAGKWTAVGRLSQGTVYRPVGTVFTIAARQVHEAYLVVHEKTLVGFYLPGESSYTPLNNAVPLSLGETE